MTIDYTKISEQMSEHPAQPGTPTRDFRRVTNGQGTKTGSLVKHRIKLAILIAIILAAFFYSPVIPIVTSIFIFQNKTVKAWLKNLTSSSKIDLSGNAFITHAVQKMSENLTPEQKEAVEKKLAEYDIKAFNDKHKVD